MRNRMATMVAALLCAPILMYAQATQAADAFKGTWTLRPSRDSGQVRFSLSYHRGDNDSRHESDWATSELHDLDLATQEKHDVQFSITRDAGRFACEGFLEEGEGVGIFTFAPDTGYARDMSALGFTGIDQDKQFAMAVLDVSLEFAGAIKAERLTGLDTDQLVAFRIHGVTPQFIHELRAEGLAAADSEHLVAFRIHGVTPEFIERVGKLGYKHPSPDDLIAMRIHGVTPEYIAGMQAHGTRNLTIDQLVNLRIHGID